MAVDFRREVQPILSRHCFACHGPDPETREADLRLDTEAGLFSVVERGRIAKSELWARVASEDTDELMPPSEHPKPLAEAQKQTLKRWIAEGATWAGHWAFETPKRPNLARDGHPVDELLRRDHSGTSWDPRPEASREMLIRRLSFDLRGLPPTLAEIDAFLADRKDGAYVRLADRFLSSQHHAERMAVWWLDGARYADTNGYQNDFGRSMWLWRDWVIDAFRRNQPFDQFAIDQIAGDMRPKPTRAQRVATGFMRNNRSVTEGGSIEEEWRVENVIDRVETVSTVFMGLTMACARCHDHKYDPISQKEFFSFFALFNNSEERGVYNEARGNTPTLLEVPGPDHRKEIAVFEERIEVLERALDLRKKEIAKLSLGELREQVRQFASEDPSDLESLLAAAHRFSTPEPSQEGLFGRTETFRGLAEDTKVFLDGPNDLDRESSFSARVWVRPQGSGVVLSKMDSDDAYRGIDLILIDDKPAAHLIHRWTEDAIKIVARDPIPRSVWSSIALSYDGLGKAKGLRIFVNGRRVEVDVHVDSLTGTIQTKEPWRLGMRSRGDEYSGQVSEFQVLPRALSAGEVLGMYRADVDRAFGESATAHETELRKFWLHSGAASTTASGSASSTWQSLARARVDLLNYRKNSVPTVMVLAERKDRRPTYLLKRGLYDAPDTSEVLAPGVPDFLPPLPKGAAADRMTFARWLVAPENPLTARVTVNRVWQELFGRGLVGTPENFGVRAPMPSHPVLLDYLAREFVESGWDLRRLIRLIVTSAAYRRDSGAAAVSWRDDPANRDYQRGPRSRLSAEMLRDSALWAAGLLVHSVGGPSVKPYQPEGLWEELAGGASQGAYRVSSGDGRYRKSLYTYRKRTVPHPTLSTFDAPSFEVCQVQRAQTNTPLQALARLNDETYAEAARMLGQRLLQTASTDAERLSFGFRLLTGRHASPSEMKVLVRALSSYQSYFESRPSEAMSFARGPVATVGSDKPNGEAKSAASKGSERPSALSAEDEASSIEVAAWTKLATLLLNLDEALVKP